jgi:hypothetical protein
MAIKVNGTTVIDDSRNLVNIVSGAGASTTAGDVGTYAFCQTDSNDTAEAGDTVAGSTLSWSNLQMLLSASPALTGTWRVMGRTVRAYNSTAGNTLWVRIS